MNAVFGKELTRIVLAAVLIIGLTAVLSYVLLGAGRSRLTAVLVAIPAAAFITLAVISVSALPVFALILTLIGVAVPVAFRWIDPMLFRQTWIAIGIALVTYLLGFYALLLPYANHEVVSGVTTINPAGASKALVVYHPGRSDLQERACTAYAEGLAANGWRVDITTASRRAPTDLSGYDLLVLGTPTYDWAPSRRLTAYLRGLGDLQGKRTVLVVSAMRMTDQAVRALEQQVRAAHGEVVASHPVWANGNVRLYGIEAPEEFMRQKAGELGAS